MNRLTRWLERQGTRIDWGIRALGLTGFAALVFLYSDFRGYVDCQAGYQEAANLRSRALADVTEQERIQVKNVIEAAARLGTDPAALTPAAQRTPAEVGRIAELYRQYVAALRVYQDGARAAEEARGRNPIPPPPSQVCG